MSKKSVCFVYLHQHQKKNQIKFTHVFLLCTKYDNIFLWLSQHISSYNIITCTDQSPFSCQRWIFICCSSSSSCSTRRMSPAVTEQWVLHFHKLISLKELRKLIKCFPEPKEMSSLSLCSPKSKELTKKSSSF